MQGNQVIAQILKAEGVEWLSCFPAQSLIDVASMEGIRPIMCRQERAGVNMADGYSRITNGNQLLIDERVENSSQAQKLARGRLAKTNEDWRTAELTLIGDPTLVAGNVIALGGTFGKYAGSYLIHVAAHTLKRASWTVRLSLKGV